MGTEFRDLLGTMNNIFNDDDIEYDQYTRRAIDANIFLNIQPQTVLPSVHHQSISDYNSLIHSQFSYDGHPLDHQNTINVEEESRRQQSIFERNSLVDLSSLSSSGLTASSSPSNVNSDSPDESEGFSDIVLSYINQILMDEESDDKLDLYPEHPALLAAEKPFYEILGEKFPPSPHRPRFHASFSSESYEENSINRSSRINGNNWDFLQRDPSAVHNFSEPSFCSTSSFDRVIAVSELGEALKLSSSEAEGNTVFEAQKMNRYSSAQGSNIRKNQRAGELDVQEGRSNKQLALFENEPSYNEFDDVLLSDGVSSSDEYQRKFQNKAKKGSQSNTGGRGRGKRQLKKEIVDLRTMLMHCAQSVSTGDSLNANELLKQIKQHASPYGDANQRLAHYFSEGLEARLAGTGSQVYRELCMKGLSVTDVLKAYRLYAAACPFKKVSHFFSDQTILNVAKNATRLHIIDFGVYHGLQWPNLLQQLSKLPGGPPKLRMTGIDLPFRGFRPSQLIEETGRRLSDYALKFGIEFKFHAIATKWETVQVEDLNIDEDEVLVVNCLYRLKNLLDESVVEDSPRNIVLNLIRKLEPAVFISGIANGSYGVPFLITRFREALFYFSSLFDAIEANATEEDEARLLLERILFGREALNVIACEGSDRNERPETYKQWQARYVNAGFSQLPLDQEIVKKVKHKVKACYHKDFVVDEDSQWLLQGWKGRTLYALSTWKPNSSL